MLRFKDSWIRRRASFSQSMVRLKQPRSLKQVVNLNNFWWQQVTFTNTSSQIFFFSGKFPPNKNDTMFHHCFTIVSHHLFLLPPLVRPVTSEPQPQLLFARVATAFGAGAGAKRTAGLESEQRASGIHIVWFFGKGKCCGNSGISKNPGGGNSKIFGIFTPKIGEMIQFDEHIF